MKNDLCEDCMFTNRFYWVCQDVKGHEGGHYYVRVQNVLDAR